MYHISDIKKFLHCERYYFYSKDTSSTFNPYLRFDEPINDLLIEYLKIDRCFMGERNDSGDRFLNEKNNFEWFCHPRLTDNELRINIPFVHRKNDVFDAYFIYYGTLIKELDLINYRVCNEVLKRNNIRIDNYYIITFNGDYIRNGDLNVDDLFLCTDMYKEKNLKKIIEEKNFDYDSILLRMDNYEPNGDAKRNKMCHQNGVCDYYKRCFPNDKKNDDSILNLVSSQNKYSMFDNGIMYLKDVDLNRLEGNRVQYAQIMASKNNGLFVDKSALREWFSLIDEDNISYVDFEWDRYLIPPYNNMKPMDVLCFEFALYYKDHGKLEHRTFVGKGDCRKEFIESLINYLPKKGPILAYNADGAEKLRLKELGLMYPEYKTSLDEINERFIDLATPFIEGLVYDVRMEGNFTLKKLVDITSEYSYQDLEIYDGMEAVHNWRLVDKGESKNEEKVVSDLKKYCSLDAYGLHLVFKWLKTLLV